MMKVPIPLVVVLMGIMAILGACSEPAASKSATPLSSYRNYTEAEVLGIFYDAVVRGCDPSGWLVEFREGYTLKEYQSASPAIHFWQVFWENPDPPPFVDISVGAFYPSYGTVNEDWPRAWPYC